MADKTGIEWTDATWNPVTGCTKVSPGCKHCYAERDWQRLSANPKTVYFGRKFTDVETHPDRLDQPTRWTKPRMIFVNSMSDLFHESIPFTFIAYVFGIMAAASWHKFQVLTKRPARMLEFFAWLDVHPERCHFDADDLREKFPGAAWQPFLLADLASQVLINQGAGLRVELADQWPLPNVWLGVSVEDQATADERVPLLLDAPAAVRWISAEPLLGPVELNGHSYSVAPGLREGIDWLTGKISQHSSIFGGDTCPWRSRDCYTFPQDANEPRIHQVIVGGESGAKARPVHPDWLRSLRDQCQEAGVPFLFKQWGAWEPAGVHPMLIRVDEKSCIVKLDGTLYGGPSQSRPTGAEGMLWVGRKPTTRLLDGVEHNGYPS